MTLLAVEVVAASRAGRWPDPAADAVAAVVLVPCDDGADPPPAWRYPARMIMVGEGADARADGAASLGVRVDAVATEAALFAALAAALAAIDPDIVLGYDATRGSIGYLVDRGAAVGVDVAATLSRAPATPSPRDRDPGAPPRLAGRVVLDVARLMRGEVKLASHGLEAVAAAVLRARAPDAPPPRVAAWWAAGPGGARWRAVAATARTARLSLGLLAALDVVGRTAEQARVYGIDFESVTTRGSQYRVEAMLARLAHASNYLLPSPAPAAVAGQAAMECVPLVAEPETGLVPCPVAVLDFQSLYPSMVIAHNLCYSTLIGRAVHVAGGAPLGVGALGHRAGLLAGALAPSRLTYTPNGVAFATADARPGVLPRLLKEVLAARVMVKLAARRAAPTDAATLRALNARQFSLKLIANVTYGYTAAGFSGRMPCAELADAIVSSGRATLEDAIALVEATTAWRARVLYGDTDSLFVALPGRSVEEAAAVGRAIAAAVTARHPPPVALKLEKVYAPCILLAKKRYAGMAYGADGRGPPTWDAKGIETVRRDACPATAKMTEACLRTLFATRDLSAVKAYACRQWARMLGGRAGVADFVFRKEVRSGGYRGPGPPPPAAIVAARAVAADPRAGPRPGDRVAYVVVCGPPRARVADLVASPAELLASNGTLRVNAAYYIAKQILPALERVLAPDGGDPRGWLAALPRPRHAPPPRTLREGAGGAPTMAAYVLSAACAVCGALTGAKRALCPPCAAAPQASAGVLIVRRVEAERRLDALVRLCTACGGGGGTRGEAGGVACTSLDCPAFFSRAAAASAAASTAAAAAGGLADLGAG